MPLLSFTAVIVNNKEPYYQQGAKMEIRHYHNDHSEVYDIYPYGNSHDIIITARIVKEINSEEWEYAKVSWYAIGFVEVKKAEKFIEGLNRAIVLATVLNNKYHPYRDLYGYHTIPGVG